ncbi:hypothetical protein E4582_09215 [Luteimonas yindakuii]|uniref:Uncharacterized protein n=1 Tax=Luteimonas yindakuii TaxID=2565782 RepID=A0A4Z1R5K2_9GAMM|nr:hypothetical protein [Luteimonas yindakuii]QCO68491.1 hypothetical protein E5843_13235 [Luteimonas yindakuii]TKS54924.1 hypothetical protein E4582_09215 [Luteimonas yindakuii]
MPAPTPRLLAISLLATVVGVAAAPAHAQDSERSDRLTLRLSAFNPEAQLRFTGDGVATNGTDTEDFFASETFDVGSKWRPRGAFDFRMSDRQSLVGNYYDYERTNAWGFDGDWLNPGGLLEGIDLPDDIPTDPVQVPAVDLSGKVKFSLASLNYEYSVVSTEAFEWGLGLGVTYAQLEARANGSWTATDEIDAGDAEYQWKKSGWSPGLHTRLTWRPTDQWRVGVEGQYLDTEWGDFLDERGHFERAGLVVEYLINDRIGVHVGYDWFRLKLKDDYSARFEGAADMDIDPVDVNGQLGGQLKVHGPMAGVTFRF